MPELPEVETVCRGLAPRLINRRLVRVDVRQTRLRWPLPRAFARRLTGRTVEAVGRRGKYIQVLLNDGWVFLIHLGMSGRLYIEGPSGPPAGPHDHVRFQFDDGTCLTYNDPRRFGMMDLVPHAKIGEHRLLQDMGPEPLAQNFTGKVLAAALVRRSASIKAALLDQKVIAGIGNIYASEILFRAGISPRRPARSIAPVKMERLVSAIKQVLAEAIAAGGSTLRDYVQASGELGYFQMRFRVYDREGKPCLACGMPIRRITQSARSTFYCRHCQS